MTVRRWLAGASLLICFALPAVADPLGGPNTFPLTGDGGSDALAQRRASRCEDNRLVPDDRIDACRSLFHRHIIEDGFLWIYIAAADEDKNDTAAAIDAYQNAIGAGQEAEALRRRARLYARTGQYDFATVDADRLVEIAGSDASAYATRCAVRGMAAKGLADALADCDRALSIAKDDKAAHDFRALTLLKLGRLDEAMADCNAALGPNGKRPASLYLRGVVERRKGDAAAASADIAAALASDSSVAARFERFGLKAETP